MAQRIAVSGLKEAALCIVFLYSVVSVHMADWNLCAYSMTCQHRNMLACFLLLILFIHLHLVTKTNIFLGCTPLLCVLLKVHEGCLAAQHFCLHPPWTPASAVSTLSGSSNMSERHYCLTGLNLSREPSHHDCVTPHCPVRNVLYLPGMQHPCDPQPPLGFLHLERQITLLAMRGTQ